MTSAKITSVVATIVALASLAAAAYEYRMATTAGQALAEATRARASAQRETARAQPPAAARRNSADAAAPGAPAAAPAGGPASPFRALLALLDNPAMQRQNQILAKMRLDGQYAALFKGLGLTPAQTDQFKDLLVEKAMVGFDSMSAANQQGIDAKSNPRAFFQAVAAAEKTVDGQISVLLGSDGYGQFQQYQETIPARNTSSLLSQALSYTATPLTETQAAGVIQVLTQYGTPPLPPGNPFAVLNGDLGVIKLSDQGLTQVQGILSAPQIQALQEKMQQQQQLLQARQRMGT